MDRKPKDKDTVGEAGMLIFVGLSSRTPIDGIRPFIIDWTFLAHRMRCSQ